MGSPSSSIFTGRRVRVGVISSMIAVSAVTAGTGIGTGTAVAAPSATAPGGTMEVPAIPYDTELAAAVRMLKDAGADQIALQAGEAILGSTGQLSPEMLIDRAKDVIPSSVAAPTHVATAPAKGANPVDITIPTSTDPQAILKAAGIQAFTPSVAPFCTDPTSDNPLGLVTAGAGGVAGPWPMKQEPLSFLEKLIPGFTAPKFNLVDDGRVVYAFVPAPDAATTTPNTTPTATTTPKTSTPTTTSTPSTAPSSGFNPNTMQVAWLNTSTLEGGFVDLKSVGDTEPLLKWVPILSNVRLAPVKTGKGTILSAVYGSAQHNGRSCFFLPAVGVVDA